MKIKKIPYLGHYLFTGLLVLALAWVTGTNAGCGGGGAGGSAPTADVSGNSKATFSTANLPEQMAQGAIAIPLFKLDTKGSVELATNQPNTAPIEAEGQSSWDASLVSDGAVAPSYLLKITVTNKFGEAVNTVSLPTTLRP